MQKKKLLLLYNQEAVWQLQRGTTKGGHSNELCCMQCPENGLYVSNVFVMDMVTGENIVVTTDWFNITGHGEKR